MPQNRVIPFGYCMKNGEITTEPREVYTVAVIFSEYLSGESLLQIAKQMESEHILYTAESDKWNKNMVKRIIENRKYLGTDKYPQIIAEDIFRQANEMRVRKATSLCAISDDLQEIRNHTYCLECGHRLSRIGGNHRSEHWDCRNADCYKLEYRLTDQMIIGAVQSMLNAVIANPSLLRVAAYCRVSTEQEEQQNSYQVQIAYYTDLINRKKEWTLAGIFADEGISGTQTKKRTEFNRMIRMCRKKKIDLVIIKSISRFSRNTVDCLEYVRQLKDLGIGVLFEKENINTLTMTSEFMIALHGSFAQAESESISKNVSWGKEKAFREGKVAFQYSKLLGYTKGKDGKPEIVPEEAETIKLIFKLFLDGYSMRNIKKYLKAKIF